MKPLCQHCKENRHGVPPGPDSTSDDFDCVCTCHSGDDYDESPGGRMRRLLHSLLWRVSPSYRRVLAIRRLLEALHG